MRAIGASKSYIGASFVLEAMMLGLLASMLGVVLGAALILGINSLHLPITTDGVRLFLMSSTLNINLHASDMLLTLVLFAILTGLAALFPALKAAKLKPVEALMQGK